MHKATEVCKHQHSSFLQIGYVSSPISQLFHDLLSIETRKVRETSNVILKGWKIGRLLGTLLYIYKHFYVSVREIKS